jgi:glycosyltransferase involved in cell wall biosynthesis
VITTRSWLASSTIEPVLKGSQLARGNRRGERASAAVSLRETTPLLDRITFPLRRRVRRLRRFVSTALPGRRSEFSDDFAAYRVRVPPADKGAARVVHAIGNFWTGGSPQLVVDIAERLTGRYEHLVLTPSNPPPRGYTGIRVVEFSPFTSIAEAERVLRRMRPDLMHVHYSPPEGGLSPWYLYVMKAAERLGVPVIENVNVPEPPLVSPAVRAYVYVSDFVLAQHGRSDSFNVRIYPGSDVDRFTPRTPAQEKDVIGMVYRLDGDKLSSASIEPLIALVRRRPATEVMIVGGGELRSVFERRVAEEGLTDRFAFTRYVSYADLPDVYSRFGLFVAPVWRESFGQVTSFAMAMGIPVVGYAVGALPEIVGDPALLAAPGDAAGLAEIMSVLLDDRERRQAIGQRNIVRARELFSVSAMIERYSGLYESILTA